MLFAACFPVSAWTILLEHFASRYPNIAAYLQSCWEFSCCFRKLQGEAGVVAAIDQADETAKMMPLYDISDEADQTELLLKELEYAAQVIVDKLEQDGQLSAWLQSSAKTWTNLVLCGNCRYSKLLSCLALDVFCFAFGGFRPT